MRFFLFTAILSSNVVGCGRTSDPLPPVVASLSAIDVPVSLSLDPSSAGLSCAHWTCDGSSYSSTKAECKAVCGAQACYYDPYCF